VQAAWAEAVGERVAAEARPTEEAKDAIVVVCSDPVWADELDLMQEQLLARLRKRLGDGAPQRLQFRAEAGRD
jgi:predicted nucleic acid-binding Zn ribbon protein